ncbi:MAG: phosphotyrosine protein phosphatase [Bacteroidota bacterium]
MKKVLFVCSANKQRSKTAEDYFSEIYPNLEFKSAGTNHKICAKEGTTPLTQDMIEWADKVFLMEEKHLKIIRDHLGNRFFNKMEVLNILDKYKYCQKELLEELNKKCFF